jgi:hypothetical protein
LATLFCFDRIEWRQAAMAKHQSKTNFVSKLLRDTNSPENNRLRRRHCHYPLFPLIALLKFFLDFPSNYYYNFAITPSSSILYSLISLSQSNTFATQPSATNASS